MKFIRTVGKETFTENISNIERYINISNVYAFRIHIFDKTNCGWVALQLDIFDNEINSDAVITYRIETYDSVRAAVIEKLKILDLINREGINLIEV